MADHPSFRLPRHATPRRYELELEPDLDEGRFAGVVVVTLDITEPTDELVLNAADLTIDQAVLTSADGTETKATVGLRADEQQAVVRLSSTVDAGSYRLRLDFKGIFDDRLRGFYRSTYRDDGGHEHVIATTQFEPSDARRAFPCWDEPDFKASFVISLVVADGLAALSNEAIASTEDLADGRRRVVFSETMVMSTYLVAFIVGPYELTEPVDVDGVPLTIATVPGRLHLARFAEDAGAHALAFLAGYFAIPYPASKIDHVAVPDFAFGAMENMGCVTYRETALLVDPAAAAQVEIQRVATVVAHETAHMWFGNLVTMKWWEGIWLNEAFATFMENLTTDAFRPDWQVWTSFGAGKQAAMVTDGLRATRPVEFTVGRPQEAEAMFDLLTYQKGGAVLRMLEQYLGPEVFRKGISHYLSSHAYGNTVTADLWNALESVSGEPVGTMMGSWIHQGGYPVISVEAGDDPSRLKFAQARFSYNPGVEAAIWSVPVTLRASVGGSVEHHRFLLDSAETELAFEGPVDWVVVNDGSWGFYRVRYSSDLTRRLIESGAVETLSPLERVGLVADIWAQVVAGIAELSEWFEVVEALSSTEDPDVWGAISTVLSSLDNLIDDDDRPHLHSFIQRVASPVWASLGWEAGEEESRRSTARARVLSVLGLTAADEAIAEEAAERFSRFSIGSTGLAPDLVGVTACIVVSSGAEDQWSSVLDLYRSSTSPQDKVRYLDALAEARQPALQERTLDLCISDEVRSQDAPFVIRDVLVQRGPAAASAWSWIEDHWDELTSLLPPTLLSRSLEGVVAVSDADLARRIDTFCAEHDIPLAGPRLDQLLERMHINVDLAGRIRGTVHSAALR